ncbi:HTH-type transcriptional regulator PgrR [Paraburkholderia domus]|jgi:Transcriptional regulator|uniref:HTH-type transcriptional regulator PgrR n=1 Tax=Paraburkholderia domus TaxID=2793075 RepID=A0A9N8R2R9_9BURK|nr:LysR family transcriptional regulator [Paraburkholderia domus]MBK5050212.1 LysR family transcriptional regulator [Burkholderia sp. R-70006]MBK5062501.1 LysR family transcriptional regulator [Burkholderia sp. R-70199]MBK5089376.1 LysR family transcriptional regulator [Burkholderia sp. R-69927]MBK5118832.1 LysR family transcriptional regulator [Burkholderia sp. R-69980]MBK5167985.1 LysR family transcriptional regulator [Burkholderia sp. R-70211]MBK5183449.1 LysR family transcriptional regula
MDRLQAMQVFTRVVDTNSFTRAAETLDLPRASVTTIIQNLEAFLGTRLMHRTTRRLSLTPDGAAYYERCVRILADVEETEASFQSGNKKPHGKLRIDMPGSIGRLLVIPSLCEFHTRYPDIDLQLGLTDRPVDLLQEGVDCVVRVGALQDSSLVARRIGLFEGVTCAAPDYIERAGMPTSLEDLENHKAVNYFSSRTGRTIDWAFMVDGKEIEVKMKGIVSVNDADAYVTCGLEGFGLIQPALFMVLPHLRSGQLVEVLPELKPLPMPISAVYPHSRHLSPKVRVFVDWIAELFDRCPLLSGRGSLDATCTKRTFEERESAPMLDTPVITEWVA